MHGHGVEQVEQDRVEVQVRRAIGLEMDKGVRRLAGALGAFLEPDGAATEDGEPAFSACDSVIIPIQCEYYALEGLSQLIHTIDLVKERLNKRLKMEGVVFTMYDARTNLSLQVVENVKENLNQNIYKTIIPRNVRLAEAPSYGQPINIYDPRSAGAESYRLLAEEVLNREDN